LNALTCNTGFAVGRAGASSGDFYGCFSNTGTNLGTAVLVRVSATDPITEVTCADGYYKTAANAVIH
jgi:hypothetical protein